MSTFLATATTQPDSLRALAASPCTCCTCCTCCTGCSGCTGTTPPAAVEAEAPASPAPAWAQRHSMNKTRQTRCCTARKIHNKSAIMDCKLFSRSHCRELLYLPCPSHLWHKAHCSRNIVTTQLQYCFVNYFHNIFGTVVQYFLQCGSGVHSEATYRGARLRRLPLPAPWS